MNRKPTKILELKGAYKRNPSRRRGAEPKPDAPLGDPPAHLDAEQAAAWQEIVGIVPAGVLTSADRIITEISACLLAEFRSDPFEFRTSRLAQLRACLGSLGLSPVDRTRLSVPDAKPSTDPWDNFRKP